MEGMAQKLSISILVTVDESGKRTSDSHERVKRQWTSLRGQDMKQMMHVDCGMCGGVVGGTSPPCSSNHSCVESDSRRASCRT